jgi:tRNA 2-thiouridine synthesizing protein A
MNDTTPDADREVDARGLACPLPILRAKKALNDLASGQILKVVATDPGSERDFAEFARQSGNRLLKAESGGREFTFWLVRR